MFGRREKMIEVYCDESRPEVILGSNSKDRYMVIGGIWVPYLYRQDIKDSINALKHKHQLYGEIKWNNVAPSKLEFYLELIDLFFDQPVRFRCIVVDGNDVDLPRYHDSDGELGFYKFYYQMLKHWIVSRENYWIYLDYKKNKQPDRLQGLKTNLNEYTLGSIKDVQAIQSDESVLIQLADVMIGAVGYRFHDLTSSKAKLQLIDRIEGRLEHPIAQTARNVTKFNVFNIDLNRGRF